MTYRTATHRTATYRTAKPPKLSKRIMLGAALIVAVVASVLAATASPSRAAVDPSDFDGRTVVLVNAATGLFLDGDNNGSVNQSRLVRSDDRWTMNQVDNDTFTFTNEDLGALLDADDANRGYDVDLSRSERADTQWRLVALADGTYNVQNVEYGQWLDADFADQDYNVDLTKKPDTSARWHIALADTSTADLPGSTVLIVNAATGRFLDGDERTVDQSAVPKLDDLWHIERHANDTVTIRNVDKQRFLRGGSNDVDLAAPNASGIEWTFASRPYSALQIQNTARGEWLDADYRRQGYNVDLTANGNDIDAGWFVLVLQRTDKPGATPTVTPTLVPTVTPTFVPTAPPTATPTTPPGVTVTPTPRVTVSATPTFVPTVTPTSPPGVTPTVTPTSPPGVTPTVTPTSPPGVTPTATPTSPPGVTPTATPTSPPGVTPTATPRPPSLDIIFVPGVPPFQCEGNDVPTETFATIINFFPNEPVQVYWSAPGRAEELLSERPANSSGARTLGWRCELGGTITFRALGTQSGATLTFDLVTLPVVEGCQPEALIAELPFDADEKVTRPITATTAFGQRDAGCAPISVAFSAGDLVWVTGETASYYQVRRLNDLNPIFIEKSAIALDRAEPGPVSEVDAAKINACTNSRRDFTSRFITIYLANDQLRGDASGNLLAFPTNLAAFRNLIGTGNELDIKNNEPILIEARRDTCGVTFFGRTVQADVPGNVLYGMIGYRYFYETQRLRQDAVLTTSLLVGAAGLAQQGGPIDNLVDEGDWAGLAVGDPACDTYAVEAGTLFERSANGGDLVTRTRAQIEADMTSQLSRVNTYLFDADSWCLGGNEQFFPEFSCSGRGHPYGIALDPIRVC